MLIAAHTHTNTHRVNEVKGQLCGDLPVNKLSSPTESWIRKQKNNEINKKQTEQSYKVINYKSDSLHKLLVFIQTRN